MMMISHFSQLWEYALCSIPITRGNGMNRKDRDRIDCELVTKWHVNVTTVRKYHDSQAVAVMYSYRRKAQKKVERKQTQLTIKF